MGPKWSKMGPKRVPKGVKKGPRGVPKWVPQRSEPKKKVEKYFFSGPTMGGYRGLPPLKTRSWEDPGHPDHVFAEFGKKVGKSPPPPADGPAGGETALLGKI